MRTDNGRESTGKAMLDWACRNQVLLKLIDPGMPDRNAYVEFFNGRLRDECLNECRFTGLTPALYAKQLASKAFTMTSALHIRVLLIAGGRRRPRDRCIDARTRTGYRHRDRGPSMDRTGPSRVAASDHQQGARIRPARLRVEAVAAQARAHP